MAFIDKSGSEWDIAVSIIRKAQDLDRERRTAELRVLIEGIGASVGNRVSETLVKALRSMFG